MPDVDPEIYTGAFYTLRYDQCKTRITDYDFAHFFEEALTGYTTDYPKYYASKALITKMFENRNMYKELSAETPDQWKWLCKQAIFESAVKWEQLLTLEDGLDLEDVSAEETVTDYGSTIRTQVQDTPYGTLDANSNYLSGQDLVTRDGSDIVTKRNDLPMDILLDARRKWKAAAQQIVEEFDDLFIRIVGDNVVL